MTICPNAPRSPACAWRKSSASARGSVPVGGAGFDDASAPALSSLLREVGGGDAVGGCSGGGSSASYWAPLKLDMGFDAGRFEKFRGSGGKFARDSEILSIRCKGA